MVAVPAAFALCLLGAMPSASAAAAATDRAPAVSQPRLSALVGHDPSNVDTAALSLVEKAGSSAASEPRPRVSTPSARSAAGATPSSKAPAGPTTGIVVTTPSDPDTVFFVHGAWNVTIAGLAPAGAAIRVADERGKVSESTVADAKGAWSVDLSFSHDGSWDQLLLIDGSSGGRALEEQLVEVQFDAPATQTPVITSPLRGDDVPGTTLPFGGGHFSVPVSGTAKPGDQIFVLGEPTDPGTGTSQDGAFARTDSTGHFTVEVPVGLGAYTFTPVAQTIDDELGPLSGYMDGQPVGPATVVLPADYILPADVDPDIAVVQDDGTGPEPTFTVDSDAVATSDPTGAPTSAPTSVPTGSTAGAGSDGSARFLATVTGTGSPGDGVQLFAADLSTYDDFTSGLYPGWFDDSTAAPSEVVPAYDGRIVVDADGHWSGTVSVPAGTFAVGAFAYDLGDPASPGSTVIGADQTFDAGGTPVIAGGTTPPPGGGSTTPTEAAAPGSSAPELAMTGDDAAAPFLVGAGLLGLGVAIAVLAPTRLSRRRSRIR
ncbi:hypothetical protein GCM10022256_33760 [Frondihabitans peucedani]|uniref:Bacterial Ig domain-containing protein n=1 Tax=Frondihabitans peucedani TaxID=598626 RepID=A0ABP8E6I8_9MICO